MDEQEKAWDNFVRGRTDGTEGMETGFIGGWYGAKRDNELVALDKHMGSIRSTVHECPGCNLRYQFEKASLKTPAPVMHCVPKSIGLFSGGVPKNCSRIILNLGESNGTGWYQGLLKKTSNTSFSVQYFPNHNTGNNFTFKKVDRPEKDKLIFCTNKEGMEDIGMRGRYLVYKTNFDHVSWSDAGGVYIDDEPALYYYEVVPVEGK